jgi:hypothetical protein
MRYGVFLPVAILGVMLGNAALAAVEITSEAVTPDGKTSQHTVYLTPDRMKFDSERVAIIVRIDTGKMVSLIKDRHEYMEIDPKQVSSRIADAQALLQQKLQALPEAQRKQMEAVFAQHGVPAAPGAPAQPPAVNSSYEKTGQTKTVGSWSCQVFHQKKNGALSADLCIAPAAALGLTPDDLAAFRAVAESMSKMLPAGARRDDPMMEFDAMSLQIGFAGLPVETVNYVSGKVLTTRTVKSIDHAPLRPDVFEVPAGYTKREMPGIVSPGATPPAQ